VIRVSATEVEVKERTDRVDDAMHATRAAVQEGIMPGGRVSCSVPPALKGIRTKNEDQETRDRAQGAVGPARQIAINAASMALSWWAR